MFICLVWISVNDGMSEAVPSLPPDQTEQVVQAFVYRGQ